MEPSYISSDMPDGPTAPAGYVPSECTVVLQSVSVVPRENEPKRPSLDAKVLIQGSGTPWDGLYHLTADKDNRDTLNAWLLDWLLAMPSVTGCQPRTCRVKVAARTSAFHDGYFVIHAVELFEDGWGQLAPVLD